jgi:hypothetical protein
MKLSEGRKEKLGRRNRSVCFLFALSMLHFIFPAVTVLVCYDRTREKILFCADHAIFMCTLSIPAVSHCNGFHVHQAEPFDPRLVGEDAKLLLELFDECYRYQTAPVALNLCDSLTGCEYSSPKAEASF